MAYCSKVERSEGPTAHLQCLASSYTEKRKERAGAYVPSMLAKGSETINKQAATMAYKIHKTQPQRA